jgi:hypothetical protein
MVMTIICHLLHDLYVEFHHHTYIHTAAIVSSFLSLLKPNVQAIQFLSDFSRWTLASHTGLQITITEKNK